jgi:uncharacterized protein YndB with AHSA1/START domain
MTTTMPTATGRRETRDRTDFVVFTRTFRAPIDDVWAAVTESDRLARWIGTWEGDPDEGHVDFRMNAEGDDVAVELFTIAACEPPRLLEIHTEPPVGATVGVGWVIELGLVESDGVTTLEFRQSVPDAEMVASVGPGWDYYLDRLVAAESGGDVSALDFDDYYPKFSDHYRREFS